MTQAIEELDPEGMTYRQILRMLEDQKELIFTVAEEDVEDLKRGITRLRSRDNSKLKAAGLAVSEETVTYTELPCTQTGCKRIQIRIGARKSVRVAKIEIPDDTI